MTVYVGLLVGALPDFPWDTPRPVRGARAGAPGRDRRPLRRHPGRPDARGGARRPSPRRPTRPGYPTTHGSLALRRAVADWFARRRGVPDLDPAAVLPTVGSKELVAWLPSLLGLGPGDVVVHPRGRLPDLRRRRAAGRCRRRSPPTTSPTGPARPDVRLVWLNSPVQPDGRGARRRRSCARWSPRRAGSGPWWRPTSATRCWRWDEPWARRRAERARPARDAAARTRACSPCTRCPSSPTSPATAPRSSPVTRRLVAAAARGPQARRDDGARRRCRPRWSRRWTTTPTSPSSAARYGRRRARPARPRSTEAGYSVVEASPAGLYLWLRARRSGRLGRPWRTSPSRASWWRPGRSTGRPGPARPGRADRDRRGGGPCRRAPDRRLIASRQVPSRVAYVTSCDGPRTERLLYYRLTGTRPTPRAMLPG